MLDAEYQQLASNSIAHAAEMTKGNRGTEMTIAFLDYSLDVECPRCKKEVDDNERISELF